LLTEYEKENKENDTMNKQAPITLTFLSYTDLIAELVYRKVAEVRLQSGVRDKSSPGAGGAWCDYIVALTALDVDREGLPVILACTLRAGGCWETFKEQHPEHLANLDEASEIVEANLERNGFRVRPGVYAHDNGWGYANPDGLWFFRKENDKAVLMAGPSEQEAEE